MLAFQVPVRKPKSKKDTSLAKSLNRDLGVHGSSILPWSVYANKKLISDPNGTYVHFIAMEDAHRLVGWGTYNKKTEEATLDHVCIASDRKMLRELVKMWADHSFMGSFVRNQIAKIMGDLPYNSHIEYESSKQAYLYLDGLITRNVKLTSKMESILGSDFVIEIVPNAWIYL